MCERTPNIFALPDAGKDKFNELHYARKLMRRCKVRCDDNRWFVYDGKSWRERKRAKQQPTALNVLPDQFKTSDNVTSIMDLLQVECQLEADERFYGAIRFDDKGRVLINCNNGIVRVSAVGVDLIDHDEEMLFTANLAANWTGLDYSPDQTPLFSRVLTESLPEAGDRALQQWFAGYLLYPSCAHEVCLISYGGAGTGKSTISDAVMAVLGGAPLRTVLSMAQLCAEGQGAYSLPCLEYAIVNMGTELDTVDISDSSNFKRLVSGEANRVRPIYGEPYDMISFVKLWFNANTLPRFKHGTDAELRRVRFLRFTQRPAVKDVTLKARMVEERDALLSWMIQGLQAIMQGQPCPEGGPDSETTKRKFAISNDPVSAFAAECCVFGGDQECKKDDFYKAFEGFLGRWGFPDKAKGPLFRLFYERYPDVAALRVRVTEVKDGKRDAGHWLLGVGLTEAEAED